MLCLGFTSVVSLLGFVDGVFEGGAAEGGVAAEGAAFFAVMANFGCKGSGVPVLCALLLDGPAAGCCAGLGGSWCN